MSQRTELDTLFVQLRLPGIRRKLREATVTEEMQAILYDLFMVEVEERERRSEHRRIKTVQFPYQKTLEDLTVLFLHFFWQSRNRQNALCHQFGNRGLYGWLQGLVYQCSLPD